MRILILDKLIKYTGRIVHIAEAILYVKIDRLKGICSGERFTQHEHMHHSDEIYGIEHESHCITILARFVHIVCFGLLVMIYELMT